MGVVLIQSKDDTTWQPVAFTSRALSETESRYAQIEKEALALVYACEKFSDYVLGKDILLETDHKPLVPFLGSKSLDTLPPRVLRFRIRLTSIADTLSRAPLSTSSINDEQKDTEMFVHVVTNSIPASSNYLDNFRKAQLQEKVCSQLTEFCKSGWPSHKQLKGDIKKYWQFQSSFSVCDNLYFLEPEL